MRTLGTVLLTAALATSAAVSSGQPSPSARVAVPGESHPYQSRLACERAPGSTLVGVMYDLSTTPRTKVTEISSGGNVGACELAIRASRNDRVCVSNGFGFTVRNLITKANSGSYATLAACTAVTSGSPALRTEPGYMDFIAPAELAPFRASLPTLGDPAVDAALHGDATMWFDEASMTFVYQDSFGDPKGLRANRVGYDVGSTASEPDIRALTEYFDPQKFKFPFALAAGANFSENLYVLYFWQPPKDATGAVLPVRIWKNRSHFQWVFPVGTVLGEILFMQAPDDKAWVPFEVRSRTRLLDRWDTGIFRPYPTATELSESIKARRPNWAQTDLAALVAHLEDTSTLTAYTLASPSYAAIVPAMQGSLDYLPGTSDVALVKELLRTKTFEKANGTSFKTDGTKTTFAPSTRASFHVVPKDYEAGMFANTEASCRRCHEHTSRPLNNLDGRVVLYGEVWGEDEIFTWHPFAIDTDTFSVADGNRRIHPRLLASGLVKEQAITNAPNVYRVLPKPYQPVYE
ncbi:MAG: hypothetical protein U0169_06700 [Polyangiaceae bacterium]